MIYYLNRGFIAELALVDIIKRYFHRLRLGNLYGNFHVSVSNEHPFAHLIEQGDTANASDIFPSITVTTQNDSKSQEMNSVPVQILAVGLGEDDLDEIFNIKRAKLKIDDETGEESTVTDKDGNTVYETIPGYIEPCGESQKSELLESAASGTLYGLSKTNRRHDSISIEIWAENNQLKNELYEHLRLFLETSIQEQMQKDYERVAPVINDSSVNGERGNNFNFDFDVPLYGANIRLEIEYSVNQIIVDTDVADVSEIVTEVENHVKKG